jgi:hypothetical protein
MAPSRWPGRLLLASASTYVALVALQEVLPWALRVVGDLPAPQKVRTSVEIHRDLAAHGQRSDLLTYPALWLAQPLPGGSDLVPLAAISNTATVFCEEQENRAVIYVSDEHGFRNTRPWTSSFDVVAVGDSFTQGACMEPRRAFVGLVEAETSPILNLGMSGNGPLLELASIKEYAAAAKPNQVLWFYYPGNDLWDLERERQHPILQRYLTKDFSQGLADRQAEIDRRLNGWLTAAWAHYDGQQLSDVIDGPSASVEPFLNILRLDPLRRAVRAAPPAAVETVELLQRVVREAHDTVTAWGGELVFVNLPDRIPTRRQSAGQRRTHAQTLERVREAGVRVIDVEAATAMVDRAELFFNRNSHYSDNGNRIVADVVRRELARR